MKTLLLSSGLFALLTAFTAQAGPESLVQAYPGSVMRYEVVEFKPVAGHHFSLEAPQDCGSGQISDKAPVSIKCQFSEAGEAHPTLNVCDDKKTYCRPMKLDIQVQDQQGGKPVLLSRNEKLNVELKHRLVPGFMIGSPGEIIRSARERGEPVFVMISTDWCPPCNESKEYLLQSPAFQRASEKWMKVYVDGDSLSAAEWDRAVPFKYYPSFVLLNSRMQEIGRFTGELRQKDFETWAGEQAAFLNDPIADLQARVLARRSGSLMQRLKDLLHGVDVASAARQEERLLKWALDTENRDLTNRLLDGREFPGLRPEILTFKIGEVDRGAGLGLVNDAKAEKKSLYDQLLETTFHGEHWSENLEGLCEVDVGACKTYVGKIHERLAFLEDRTGLLEAEKESQLGDEYFYLAQVYEAVGDKAGLKEFGQKCVGHFDAMKKKSLLKISRAGQQGMVACLEMVGDYARETQVLNSLIEAYPNEPTFLMRMGRMYRKRKEPTEALTWINKAEALAYGYNWFSIRVLKAQVLLDLKKPKEADQAVVDTLAQVKLTGEKDSRDQSLVARLRGLQMKAQNVVGN